MDKWLKPLQNKKGQKNLGYPRKKQSFYKEKDCFFLGYPKFVWPFLFWSGFSNVWVAKKDTKRSSVLLLRLVRFSTTQTLHL